MAIISLGIHTKGKQGFVLLIAIIFMSVILSLALALGSLAYKQQVLTATAIDSQYAFYASDSGLECLLYADQKLNNFEYATHGASSMPALVSCGGVSAARQSYSYTGTVLIDVQRLEVDSGRRCVDLITYKYANGNTTLFSQGYNVSCQTVAVPGNARLVSRGIKASY